MSYSLVRRCESCKALNRIPARRLSDAGRCGSCHGVLPPLSEPLPVPEADFNGIIAEAQVPVLVDFWASWCGPCRSVAPEIVALAKESAGKALILKVETDANPALAARFNIASIPTFLVFNAGAVVSRYSGAVRRELLRSWLQAAGANTKAARA